MGTSACLKETRTRKCLLGVELRSALALLKRVILVRDNRNVMYRVEFKLAK
jgi:hypothetical protein